jgi:ribosomal protein L16/L10AE
LLEPFKKNALEEKSMGKNMVYTRREYIHRMPQPMISKFTLGDSTVKYEFAVSLIASKKVQISSNALEAIRITTNKALASTIGEEAYILKIYTKNTHISSSSHSGTQIHELCGS